MLKIPRFSQSHILAKDNRTLALETLEGKVLTSMLCHQERIETKSKMTLTK